MLNESSAGTTLMRKCSNRREGKEVRAIRECCAARRENSVARQRVIGYRQRLLDVFTQCPSPVKARSSVGERFLDTEEVGGSIPPVPTRSVPRAARAIFVFQFPAMIKFFA